jgi:cytochrome c2
MLTLKRSYKTACLAGTLFATSVLLIASNLQSPAKSPAVTRNPPAYKPHSPTPESLKGKEIFNQQKCISCHSIKEEGGCLAPPLDGVGKHRTEQFLTARITDSPEAISQFDRLYKLPELMPHPRLAPQKAKLVVAYLLTLPEPPHGFAVTEHIAVKGVATKIEPDSNTPQQESIREGQRLYNSLGCAACHSIHDVGGHIGPELDHVSQRRSTEYIIGHMSGARFKFESGQSKMPRVNATPDEMKKIANFLLSLP